MSRSPRQQGPLSLPWLPPALVAILSLGSIAPLLLGPLPATHDGLHHLFRLFELDRSLRAGVLYPRIFADMGFGYGYPVLNFYSPLSYYLAWLATAAGAGYLGGIRFAYAIGSVAAALAMYLWAASFLPRPGALLAALAYAYFPYHVADILVRGALAEATAFIWPPLLLWLLTRYWVSRQGRYLPGLALATAGFILTHNLTAFMFAPLLALYIVLLLGWPRRESWPCYAAILTSVMLGVLLSAFYWLPAALEVKYVLAGQAHGLTDLLSLLQPLGQWLSPFLAHRYTPLQGVAAQHPFSLSQAGLALAGALAAALAWRGAGRIARVALTTAALSLATSLFLLTPASAPLWRLLTPLQFLQFPWRLQAVTCLATAIIAGALFLRLPASPAAWALSLALAGLVAANSMTGLRLEPAHLPSSQKPLSESQVTLDGLLDYDFQTALWLRQYGGEWLLEYLPVWALPERATFFLPAKQPATLPALPAGSSLTVVEDGPLRTAVRVNLPQAAVLCLHRFYFPGWQVSVDGRVMPARPVGPLGLVGADIPAGEHQLTWSLGWTPCRLGGAMLSLAAPLIGVAWALWRRQVSAVAVSLGVILLFFGLVMLRAWRYPTIRRPQALQAQLGEVAALAGYALEKRPGGADVWLYWLSLSDPTQDYRVFVHAEGSSGRVGQHDGQPGNEFSPTTRWQAGELVPDRHMLKTTAPAFGLYAGMYTWPDIANLPAMQDGSAIPDGRINLGEAKRP